MRPRQKRRGIGELLSVIIVMAITIVAALVVYSMVMQRVSQLGNSPGIEIENIQLSNGILTVSVKNSGSYEFSSITMQVIYNGQAQTIAPLGSSSGSAQETLGMNVAPGESVSAAFALNESVGGTYTVIIVGSYGSGQSYTITGNVVAS